MFSGAQGSGVGVVVLVGMAVLVAVALGTAVGVGVVLFPQLARKIVKMSAEQMVYQGSLFIYPNFNN